MNVMQVPVEARAVGFLWSWEYGQVLKTKLGSLAKLRPEPIGMKLQPDMMII